MATIYDFMDKASRGQIKLTSRRMNGAVSAFQQQSMRKFLDTVSAVDYFGAPWPLAYLHSVHYVSTVLSFVQHEMLQFIGLLEEAHHQATTVTARCFSPGDQDGPLYITPDVFDAFPIDVATLNQQAEQLVASQPVPVYSVDIQKVGKGLIGVIKWEMVDEAVMYIQRFFYAITSSHLVAALNSLGTARFHSYWVDIIGHGSLDRIRYYLGNVMVYHTIPTLLAALIGNGQDPAVPDFIARVMALPEVQTQFAQTPPSGINYYETALQYTAVLDSAYTRKAIQALQAQGKIDLRDLLVCSQVGDHPVHVAGRVTEALDVPKSPVTDATTAAGYAHCKAWYQQHTRAVTPRSDKLALGPVVQGA
ncbi:hypothetical protein H4R34_001838 [Dimargaris verticillata]|uniref:Uncharacterized protein n=1 Tax=Dimargaris verticillata TaxID=2761393 RepID=A0A9W8B3W4_9FUNG|nr:hypothetical protein H4R34_001838 [Dimargaris verticillata]